MCQQEQWECCTEEGNAQCRCCPANCLNCEEYNCSLMPCLSYTHLIAFVRAFFLFLHTLLLASSIFGLIWSNVYFNDFDRTFLGSFVGGHLATLSAGGLLFGLSGLYAAIKHHRRLLYTHAVITWTAVLLRGFTWLLAMLHEYKLELFVYGVAPIELLLAFLSSILLRDASIYY